tara:strand:+ start:1255 stop:2139 length:885 start_codon:yes stop_codon:yes gene_type:complete
METPTLKTVFMDLNKLNKQSIISICKNNKYKCSVKFTKIKLIHIILKNKYKKFVYNNNINYIDIESNIIENYIIYLNTLKIKELKNILNIYGLSKNGNKYFLIDRIIKFKYYNKIVTYKTQLKLLAYKFQENLLYIPEKNYFGTNYELYNVNKIYTPYDFYNIDEYTKHLENLKYLNKINLIYEQLFILSERWVPLITVVCNMLDLSLPTYDNMLSTIIDNKYNINNNNTTIINNINNFICNNEECNNCIICMDNINKNDKCKKLDCGHIFHSSCIDNWLMRVLECPMCRKTIT